MPLYHDTDKVPILVAYQALSALGREMRLFGDMHSGRRGWESSGSA